MLSRKSNIVLIFLSTLVYLNCSKESNPVGLNAQKEIIPLNLNNSWNYHITAYDTSGNIYMSVNVSEKINGDTIIENQKWYYQDKAALFCANKSDGYYTFDKNALDTTRINLVYKYPCIVGDKYSYWEVVKQDTQITVPAGNFNCVLYSYRLKTSDSFNCYDVYIKPGIGKIKSVQYGLVGNHPVFEWTIRELTSYNLK